jgi:hypothetical protein
MAIEADEYTKTVMRKACCIAMFAPIIALKDGSNSRDN